MYYRKHWEAASWMEDKFLGPRWKEIYKFAVMRNPWHIMASHYRLSRLLNEELNLPFDDYVRRRFINNRHRHRLQRFRGFWRAYCGDKEGCDCGINLIPFEELTDRWPSICRRILPPHIERKPLLHINQGAKTRIKWTEKIIQEIGDFFCDDVDRFGFVPPEVS